MGKPSIGLEIISSKNIINTKRNRVTSLEGIQSFLTLSGFGTYDQQPKRSRTRIKKENFSKPKINDKPEENALKKSKITTKMEEKIDLKENNKSEFLQKNEENLLLKSERNQRKKYQRRQKISIDSEEYKYQRRKRVKIQEYDPDFRPSNRITSIKLENVDQKGNNILNKSNGVSIENSERPKRNRILSLEGLLSILTAEDYYLPGTNYKATSNHKNGALFNNSSSGKQASVEIKKEVPKRTYTKRSKKVEEPIKPDFPKNKNDPSLSLAQEQNNKINELTNSKPKRGRKPKLQNLKKPPTKQGKDKHAVVLQRSAGILKNKMKVLQTLSKTEPPVKIEED